MSIPPGTRFGSYTIVESIGAGGMGEVYRATDADLKRDVAIKVLPESFASDANRLARFQREAEVLASLNHSNIAHIYGLERSGGATALVMEIVEGPTLADRIAQGPVPVDEALNIAMQIADALGAAHEQHIIHRDLKPANIKLRPDGTVKVLDFGIAKALDTRPISGPQAPPLTPPAMTEAGIVLGTGAYMSPEQARGKHVDQRADIWAFGCVLYEMLTGQPAFGGEDLTTTLARVLERGADLNALPRTCSPAVRHTLKLCLEKDVRKRVADIRDVKLALTGAFETGSGDSVASAAVAARARRGWWVAAVAGLGMLALALPALEHLRKTPPPETRVDIVTPPATNPFFALSPDGRQLVFRATDEDGQSRLWLRALATTSAQPLPGTEGAGGPFWSPDGRSLGFFAAGALKRLDLGGGAPRILAPVTLSRGGAWGADGAVVFADSGNPLLRVSADGGEVSAVTTLGPEQGGHVHPHLLPDGRHVLFYAPGTGDMAGIYLGELEGGASIRLTAAESHGEYLPSGWLLWVRAGALVAQRLDLARATLTGEPLTLADGVAVSDEAQGRGAFAVSAAGLVAYRTGGQADARQLTWVDRAGTVLGTIGDADGSLHNPRVAPDGQRVAVARTVQSNTDLWLLDDMRASRFTFVASADQYPVWSADGGRLVFSSTRAGQFDLYQRLVSGAAEEEALLLSDQDKFASNLTADGRFLLYFIVGAQGTDLWVLATAGKPTPLPFLQTRFNERWGAFSPDGRWVAYASNESGRDEIYVRPFVPPGEESTAAVTVGQWQVSTAGGIQPLWSPDGRELYYLNPEGGMMAAAVSVSADGFAPGAPELLFPTRIVGSGLSQGQGRQYDVAADGRFLINTVLNTATPPPITLIQNWNPPETP